MAEQGKGHLSTCTEHTHQHLLSYCRTCHKRVCEKCVKGPHSEHDWTFLHNHIGEMRNEGQKIAKQIRDEVTELLKRKRDGTAREQEVAKIRHAQENLKNLIDEYADEMVSQLDVDDQIIDVDREIDEFEKLADFFENKVQIEYDSAVVEMEEELHAKLHQHKASNAVSKSNVRRFQEGKVNKDIIKSIMGRVERVNENSNTSGVDVTVVKTVTCEEEMIASIEAISENSIWIDRKKGKKTYLIDEDGKLKITQEYWTSMTDFIVADKSHIFTSREKKYIGRLSSGEDIKLCSTAPLGPNGICHSRDGGMLVCLADCSISNIKPSSQGEVHHMDMSGRIRKRYYQDESGHTKLFRFPYRVAQNINYDLCVCDLLEMRKRQRLVVVAKDSRIRFIYKGHSTLKEECTVNDVVCDFSGRIILSDWLNHAIHMLSADGQFIQFLLTRKDGLDRPTALALHGETMWVGNSTGIIKICKLKQRL